jgi:hypothetical protein
MDYIWTPASQENTHRLNGTFVFGSSHLHSLSCPARLGSSIFSFFWRFHNFLWTPYGLRKDSVWTPYGLYMNSIWTAYRLYIDSIWTPYRLHMDSI